MQQYPSHLLYGACAGDIVGSNYEGRNKKVAYDQINLISPHKRFTDDTVCTFGVAEALVDGSTDFKRYIHKWCRNNPHRGYGAKFKEWIASNNPQPYGSYGNGSAMRVSPIGFYAYSETEVLELAELSASCSHNSPEGIKGAQAISLCVFRAFRYQDKRIIREILEKYYPKYANLTLNDIRPSYGFTSTCEGSVPVAILAFLESSDYVDAIKLSISMNGDSDTLAAMAGGIAYAYYKTMPAELIRFVDAQITENMHVISENFDKLPYETR